jgi:hypothetical protein
MPTNLERRVAAVEKSRSTDPVHELLLPARVNFGDLADVERRLERIDALMTRIGAKITTMRIRMDRLEADLDRLEVELAIDDDGDDDR